MVSRHLRSSTESLYFPMKVGFYVVKRVREHPHKPDRGARTPSPPAAALSGVKGSYHEEGTLGWGRYDLRYVDGRLR
jgi:hypothetical protein